MVFNYYFSFIASIYFVELSTDIGERGNVAKRISEGV